MDQSISFCRRIGVGDREHVRGQMLSVGLLTREHVRSQILGAMGAADKLGMMLRAHINVTKMTDAEYMAIVSIFHRNSTHQLIDHVKLTREKYEGIQSTFDIVVRHSGFLNGIDPEIVQHGILDVWKTNGGRFLNGNFARLSNDQLRVKYPDFYEDSEPEFEEFQK